MGKAVDSSTLIRICPNCGNKNTNMISKINAFCPECCVEFCVKTNKVFTILYNGDLVDYYVNEFVDCG